MVKLFHQISYHSNHFRVGFINPKFTKLSILIIVGRIRNHLFNCKFLGSRNMKFRVDRLDLALDTDDKDS